jgi:predicted aminopeptidase
MKNPFSLIGWGVFALLSMIAMGMYGCPKYNVWQQTLAGEAELKRAEQNRKITIQEAEAKKESAKALADAEVIRATGVAQANRILGESLKGNEVYLHYLWLEHLEKANVVYIPTEAGMPIMEANTNTKTKKDTIK